MKRGSEMDYKITYLRDGRVLKWKTVKSLAGWYTRHYVRQATAQLKSLA